MLEGYVLIPSILPPDQIRDLRYACDLVQSMAYSGKWPHVRTLPKQFPPWSSDTSNGIWGIQHLMHPELPMHDLFAVSYFSDSIIEPVKRLLSCSEDELVMELYNLLITPTHDFSLRWHRDDVPPSASPEEEAAILTSERCWHAQWNFALYDDESLLVVPGSHRRARSIAEKKAAEGRETQMVGQKRVCLKAGDVIFYDNNILHRGVYDSQVQRMTLHGSIGHVSGGKARARNVLQHGVSAWVSQCSFEGLQDEGVRRRAEGMRRRLLELGRQAEEGDLGFSQDD